MKLNAPTRFAGPPLLPLALVSTLLFAANLISAALLRRGAPFVTPFGDAEAARAFFATNPLAVKVSAPIPTALAVPSLKLPFAKVPPAKVMVALLLI